MDNQEARDLLYRELARYRSQTYLQLQGFLNTEDKSEIAGPSGTVYQIEIQVFLDSPGGGDIRVMAAIDDKGWRAFMPLCRDFIMAPDGRFVGEPPTGT